MFERGTQVEQRLNYNDLHMKRNKIYVCYRVYLYVNLHIITHNNTLFIVSCVTVHTGILSYTYIPIPMYEPII